MWGTESLYSANTTLTQAQFLRRRHRYENSISYIVMSLVRAADALGAAAKNRLFSLLFGIVWRSNKEDGLLRSGRGGGRMNAALNSSVSWLAFGTTPMTNNNDEALMFICVGRAAKRAKRRRKEEWGGFPYSASPLK